MQDDPLVVRKQELRAQLIALRLSLDLTQKEFADLTGVQQSLVSRLENGSHNIIIERLQEILVRSNTGARLKKKRIEMTEYNFKKGSCKNEDWK
ncbi:helix-turn-helix transcriptional regulator [Salinicoccus carnicancri]|uniref:helix-turn-helix transcriptional regulator n=1 Tax=Salinicoccus carnicancri TaxID=558170 RepID=UPI00036E6977|nr:helix-turn-helix transcriptional regulator [Salinicoccus carnicancri]